jgi:hypothetical protein
MAAALTSEWSSTDIIKRVDLKIFCIATSTEICDFCGAQKD